MAAGIRLLTAIVRVLYTAADMGHTASRDGRTLVGRPVIVPIREALDHSCGIRGIEEDPAHRTSFATLLARSNSIVLNDHDDASIVTAGPITATIGELYREPPTPQSNVITQAGGRYRDDYDFYGGGVAEVGGSGVLSAGSGGYACVDGCRAPDGADLLV